jgi:AraC-like DNA-binding protein
MIYHKFAPSAGLKDFVECYYVWQSEGEEHLLLNVESPPSGFCSIVFNSGDPYFLQNKKYDKLEVPRQFIAGQSIYSYELFFNAPISLSGIVFKPAALATLFNLPTFVYTEERIDLYKIFKKEIIDTCVESINLTGDEEEKVKLLEQFVLACRNKDSVADHIDFSANYIVEHNGMVHVADLLKDSCMSRRTYERHFFKKVGLSPKYYARIRRISYLCNLIAGKKKVNWPQLFYDCEFYDQAHFVKDFEEFTGRSPRQYLQENNELANFVEKPTTLSVKD